MFEKILVANRGEIACRVIATAQKMGVRTVAVYSDADKTAKHVAMADEAVRVGPAAVAESYLDADAILAAAKRTGAQAIHPGYGFLSENPEFVEAVEAAGLTFIGPTAAAIRAMGLKDAAKSLMERSGVPVVPGYHGAEQDADALAVEAEAIGYPVLIKARAGGGGKGMRLVEDPADFHAALEGAQREGQASFGDPACLIEKYITQPRHIEIQVFGDTHGNVIHLFERDCSLQRRHQKVIEEAPAPDMPQAVRDAMGQAAVNAAKAIGYVGAGTVEFIVDGAGPLREDGFWFMEMNTRLQVEHPVSEAITGLDFVELQLRIAAGEAIPVQQDALSIDGWSFEARVYAEDVAKGFLPATGVLDHLQFPTGTTFDRGAVRIDSGVRAGDEISPWYDPMIAKVIVHGPTRDAALRLLSEALSSCHIAGAVTNLCFLGQLAKSPEFMRGEVDTGLIARHLDTLTSEGQMSHLAPALAALQSLDLLQHRGGGTDEATPWATLTGWRHWHLARQIACLAQAGDAGDTVDYPVTFHKNGSYTVEVSGETRTLEVAQTGPTTFRISTENQQLNADVVQSGRTITVFIAGEAISFECPDPLAGRADDSTGEDTIRAPMPGLVQQVFVEAGAEIEAGTPLLVLEAMKMEHTLSAPRDGTVAELLCQAGDQVSDGSLLLALEQIDG